MTKTFSTQASAFALAAVVTLATLGSLNGLAAQDAVRSAASNGGETVQQVVVIGQRVARS